MNFGGGFPFGDIPGFGGGFPGGMPGGPGMGRKKSDNEKYYKMLGVERTASQDELKKAHRKAAMKHHPDKGGDAETFRNINEAYDVLKDPKKREVYDQYGEDAIKEGMHEHGGGGGGMADIFDMMNGGRGGRQRERKGDNVTHKLKVTLEECYSGSVRKLQLTRRMKCGTCSGTGSKSGRSMTCATCNGQGIVLQMRQLGPGMVTQMQAHCPDCGGSGERTDPADRCSDCGGKKLKPEKKVFEVPVEKGHANGMKVVLRGEAGYSDPTALPGDIVFIIEEKEHAVFTRKKSDLFYKKEISLSEALCGVKFTIPHLDGRHLLIETKPGEVIKPGEYKAITDEGMPRHGSSFDRGSLYIEFDVKFPETLSASAMGALKAALPDGGSSSMDTDDAEEVELRAVDVSAEIRNARARGARRPMGAGSADSDSDDEGFPGGRGPGGQRVQCAQQ